jgi:hypothetical protein
MSQATGDAKLSGSCTMPDTVCQKENRFCIRILCLPAYRLSDHSSLSNMQICSLYRFADYTEDIVCRHGLIDARLKPFIHGRVIRLSSESMIAGCFGSEGLVSHLSSLKLRCDLMVRVSGIFDASMAFFDLWGLSVWDIGRVPSRYRSEVF